MFNKLTETKNKLSKKSKIIIIASSVLVVIVALVLAWFYIISPYLNKINTPPLTADEKYSQLADSVVERLNKNDYQGLMSAIDVEIANTTDKDQKTRLYLLKSSTAYEIGKFDEAYKSAQSAEDANPTDATARMLADVYLAVGNKDKAIEYYNLAIDRTTVNSEMDYQVVLSLKQKILVAQGKINEE